MLIITFNENSYKNRKQFFSNPMIQFIWANHYLREQSQTVLQYLRRIKGQKDGYIKVSKLIHEIEGIEEQAGFKILPESIPRDAQEILPFEPNEELEYLSQNARYNKKYRSKVQDEILRLQTFATATNLNN